jgi:hypothetical protein
MSQQASLPPLPIAEAAGEIAFYEQSEPFRPSGEIQLGDGFSDPAKAALDSESKSRVHVPPLS